jgi:hypothetical protein
MRVLEAKETKLEEWRSDVDDARLERLCTNQADIRVTYTETRNFVDNRMLVCGTLPPTISSTNEQLRQDILCNACNVPLSETVFPGITLVTSHRLVASMRPSF